MLAASCILSSYCVSSSTSMMPYLFGYMGYVVGPVVLGTYLWIGMTLQKLILDVALHYPTVKTMPETVKLVVGPSFARFAYILQFLNQQITMPVYTVFAVKALKAALYPFGAHQDNTGFPDWTSCNILWLIVPTILALLAVNSQRAYNDSSSFCILTGILNVTQVLIMVRGVLLHDLGTNSSNPVTERHGAPDFYLNTNPNSRGYWVNVLQCYSIMSFMYEPVFIATEIMQEMKDKRQIKRSIELATLSMYIIYVAAGSLPAAMWGWQRNSYFLNELGHSWPSRLANVFLFIPTCADFLITAISLNKMVAEVLDPGIDLDKWDAQTRWKWFSISFPPLMLSLVMCCVIPELTNLCGIVTALVIPVAQMVVPAVTGLIASRKNMLGGRTLSISEIIAITLGINMGLFMFVFGGISTLYSVVFLTSYEGNFFCDLVAG